jgi:hypothetical protein
MGAENGEETMRKAHSPSFHRAKTSNSAMQDNSKYQAEKENDQH